VKARELSPGWAVAVLALPAALALGWGALRSPLPVATLAPAPLASGPVQNCQNGRLVADGVTIKAQTAGKGADVDFLSSGLLRLEACGPGTLSFTASGSRAGGQDAALTVALGAVPLLDTTARQPRTFRLRVTGPGWLSFGFPNDYYRPPEDRNLFLRDLKFVPD
jgi:hypothetical protein